MDSGTIIIGIVMLVLCAIPFILSGSNRKSNEEKIKKSFSEIALKNNITVIQSDFWFNSGIGINSINQQLLFYRKIKDQENIYNINLKEFQKSKVSRFNDSSSHIEKLELILAPYSKTSKEITLEFYNAEFNPQLNGEVQLIEKWNKLINDVIKTPEEIKKAV